MGPTGQAEGHDNTSTVQKPHVQLWNYDSLDLVHIIGLDSFESDIGALAFLGEGDDLMLAVVDASHRPELSVYSDLQSDDGPSRKFSEVAASTKVHSLTSSGKGMVMTGHGHVTLWRIDNESEDENEEDEESLKRKQGLFTRKIDRPKDVYCAAYAENGDILTGDSDGNVMVWKANKVVRVLKGAHRGAVGDICVHSDGSFVSGGLEDGALVVFNADYQLIGAGATMPENLGKIRRLQSRRFSADDDGARFYHLVVGTTSNNIVEASFNIGKDGDDSTNIAEVEFETIVQGHGDEVRDVVDIARSDKFLSGSKDGLLVLWDATAHKALWTVEMDDAVNAIDASKAKDIFAVGLENGHLMIGDLEENGSNLETVEVSSSICGVAFAPNNEFLAVATMDNDIRVFCRDGDSDKFEETFNFSGHSAHVKHMDWSDDSLFLRSNSADHELLFWSVESRGQVTDLDQLDDLDSWASQRCTITFETLGIWPEIADGTDINVCDANGDLLIVGDDFGRVKLYNYPAHRTHVKSKELLGHSAHVSGVTALRGSDVARIVSAGGREASLIQWAAI